MIIEYEPGKTFNFDRIFKKPLDTICYNIGEEWDFVLLCTGSGLTRGGKSTFVQQLGMYCSRRLGTPFTNNNIVFGGKQLIERAKTLPHGSVIIDDESREDISGKRSMEYMNKELLDFFNECGMYNHLIILVATDFFDFSKSIAVTRSEMLFNVTRQISKPITLKDGAEVVKLERGHVDFYDRKAKRKFYIFGKKAYDDYEVGVKYRTFFGHFTKEWILDKDQYLKDKIAYVERDREAKRSGWRLLAKLINSDMGRGESTKQIGYRIGVGQRYIEIILKENREYLEALNPALYD